MAAAAGDNAGAGGLVLPGVAELVMHARTFTRSRGLADGVGEGAAGELPAAWGSAPLSSALIGFGGTDGVLDRADGFLRATAA
ncbi:MAG: hypothetical protein DK306_001130 [Chloroflexi bacterium]|nr:MAG: hypothetical protein DK306_001130 [Chloroflexota bacterium]